MLSLYLKCMIQNVLARSNKCNRIFTRVTEQSYRTGRRERRTKDGLDNSWKRREEILSYRETVLNAGHTEQQLIFYFVSLSVLFVYMDTQIVSIVKFFSAYFTNGVVNMFISFHCHTTNQEHNAIKKLLPLPQLAKKLLPKQIAPRSTKRNLILGNQGANTLTIIAIN
jgi:hypothetical protein